MCWLNIAGHLNGIARQNMTSMRNDARTIDTDDRYWEFITTITPRNLCNLYWNTIYESAKVYKTSPSSGS